MTSQLQTTLTELVQMAHAGNVHAVPTLRQVLDATTDRLDRQHVRLAIAHAEGRHARKPKAAPAISPAVFEMDAETARRWAMVQAAAR